MAILILLVIFQCLVISLSMPSVIGSWPQPCIAFPTIALLEQQQVGANQNQDPVLTEEAVKKRTSPFPSQAEFDEYNETKAIPPFDIDVVINWGGYRMDTANEHVRDQGELQYALRSIYLNMPWFHRIFIVCPDALAENLSESPLWPPWLDEQKLQFTTPSNGKAHELTFVAQSSILAFNRSNGVDNHNSNAFEINMHRIPQLSEWFISMCDDFFIGRPLPWTFFFTDDSVVTASYNKGWIPRMPWAVFQKYYHGQFFDAKVTRSYPTTYDCDMTEEEPTVFESQFEIPPRVEKYYSHIPRPLTKTLMAELHARYPKWFRFVESHRDRYCCPGDLKKYGSGHWKCGRQEGLWLPLFRLYIDFEIPIDIMATDVVKKYNAELVVSVPYKVSARDLIGFYHPGFAQQQKLSRLLELRPYTFSVNDYYSDDNPSLYVIEYVSLHNFANLFWPQQAPFEVVTTNDMPYYKTALALPKRISLPVNTRSGVGFFRSWIT